MSETLRTSGKTLRYGYGNHLYRIIAVALNENRSARGNRPLHRVSAVRVETGEPATWWIQSDALSYYGVTA